MRSPAILPQGPGTRPGPPPGGLLNHRLGSTIIVFQNMAGVYLPGPLLDRPTPLSHLGINPGSDDQKADRKFKALPRTGDQPSDEARTANLVAL